MRLNTPVTAVEYPFPRGETLVSTTDLKGRITYCNPAFVVVSGYAREELLGQPHNMIRHPDMPEEAFRDMWATIAGGLPWSAPVKNRRKDGSFYWVMANVTPLMEGDRPVGYMSVRTEPTREAVAAAEALYATMRAEKSAGTLKHTLSAGRLVKSGWAGRLQRLADCGPQARLAGTCAALAAVGVAAGHVSGDQLPLVATAVVLAGALAGGTALHAMTVRPLRALLGFANRMAAGDLTQRVDDARHDVVGRLGQALNQLNVNLQSIVRYARNEVDRMRTVTGEIANGNHDLSSRTESQASSLQQTAASMEEITGTVRQSADSAEQATRLAGGAPRSRSAAATPCRM